MLQLKRKRSILIRTSMARILKIVIIFYDSKWQTSFQASVEKWHIKMLQLKGVSPTFWQDDLNHLTPLADKSRKNSFIRIWILINQKFAIIYEKQNGKHFEIKMTKRSQIQYILVNRFWQIQCISFTFITDNSTLKIFFDK